MSLAGSLEPIAAGGSFREAAARLRRVRARLAHTFSADPRSLALTRIGVAAAVLLDLLLRVRDLSAFYSDEGLMPRADWLASYRNAWSLHVLSGRPTMILLLFGLHAVAALALLAGYRTRLASVATWVLTASLHARNPAVLQGGDTLLLLLLFWGMFVPWGAQISADGMRVALGRSRRVLSVGVVGLLLQMPLVYLFAALQKSGPEWRVNFRAVYYALNDDFIASRLGKLVGGLPLPALKTLTITTLVVEIALPVLLLLPVRSRKPRWVALAVALGLQVGFGLCFNIGLFPLVSTIALLAFLPASAWTRIDTWSRYQRARAWLVARFAAAGARPASPAPANPAAPSRWRFVAEVACGVAIATMLWSNLAALDLVRVPSSIKTAVSTFRLGQGWKMFVKPGKNHGWYVAVGGAKGGRRVDLLNDDAESVHWDKPDQVSDSFENYRWRKYFGNVRQKNMNEQHPALARYLCRTWNREHGSDEHVGRVKLYYMTQPIDGRARPGDPKKKLVFNETCAKPGRSSKKPGPRTEPEPAEPQSALEPSETSLLASNASK